jgi:hypothetical protein
VFWAFGPKDIRSTCDQVEINFPVGRPTAEYCSSILTMFHTVALGVDYVVDDFSSVFRPHLAEGLVDSKVRAKKRLLILDTPEHVDSENIKFQNLI